MSFSIVLYAGLQWVRVLLHKARDERVSCSGVRLSQAVVGAPSDEDAAECVDCHRVEFHAKRGAELAPPQLVPKAIVVKGDQLRKHRETYLSRCSTRRSKALTAKPAHGSKSAFVGALPPDMPAKEVVAKGKAEGISLSIAQVYNIRSVTKTKGDSRKVRKDARMLKSTAQLHLIRSKAPKTDGDGGEARLRKLIAEVGLARAREVMAEVAAAFEG